MKLLFLFLLTMEAFGMGCDPSPGGNCTQPDGVHTCKIENESHCYVSSGASCSRINNNSGLGLFMGAHPETQDLAIFMRNIPRGVTVSTCGCTGGMQNWSVGPNNCRANLRDLAHGETLEINDETSPGTGAATFSCTGATLTGPSGASCDSLPPTICRGTDLRWRVGSNDCEMRVPDSDDGTPIAAVDSAGPATGTADFTCNGTTWSVASNPVCNAPPSVGCTLTTPIVWRTFSRFGQAKDCTINGGPFAFREGEERDITGGQGVDWGAYPTRVTARYRCSGGELTQLSRSCIADCTFKCNDGGGSETHQWIQAGNTCYCAGGRLETIPHGGSRSFGSWNSNGDLTVSCNDGDPTYVGTCRGGAPE